MADRQSDAQIWMQEQLDFIAGVSVKSQCVRFDGFTGMKINKVRDKKKRFPTLLFYLWRTLRAKSSSSEDTHIFIKNRILKKIHIILHQIYSSNGLASLFFPTWFTNESALTHPWQDVCFTLNFLYIYKNLLFFFFLFFSLMTLYCATKYHP